MSLFSFSPVHVTEQLAPVQALLRRQEALQVGLSTHFLSHHYEAHFDRHCLTFLLTYFVAYLPYLFSFILGLQRLIDVIDKLLNDKNALQPLRARLYLQCSTLSAA